MWVGALAVTFIVLSFSGMVEDSFAQTVVANAGPDQIVGSGATVTLDGSGSSNFLTHLFRWSEPTGSISFSGFDEIRPTFTAPTAPATLTITLTVSTGGGVSATDTVIITVSDTPTANAGSNQNVNRGAIVTLDGTGSTDPNGDTLNYSWAHTSEPSVNLSSNTIAQPTFTPTSLGTIVFTLTVSDGTLSDTDTVSITILNQSPTANAGPDKTFAPKSTVTLNGSGTDPDNDPLTYTWSQDSGTPVIITDATSARTTFTAPADPTELVFTLTVEDDTGTNTDTDTDTITITIAKPVTRNIKEMSETLISATITAPNQITMIYNEELSTFINSYLNFTISGEDMPRSIIGINGSPSIEGVVNIDGVDTTVFITTLTFNGEPAPFGSTGSMYIQHADHYLAFIHVSDGQD